MIIIIVIIIIIIILFVPKTTMEVLLYCQKQERALLSFVPITYYERRLTLLYTERLRTKQNRSARSLVALTEIEERTIQQRESLLFYEELSLFYFCAL